MSGTDNTLNGFLIKRREKVSKNFLFILNCDKILLMQNLPSKTLLVSSSIALRIWCFKTTVCPQIWFFFFILQVLFQTTGTLYKLKQQPHRKYYRLIHGGRNDPVLKDSACLTCHMFTHLTVTIFQWLNHRKMGVWAIEAQGDIGRVKGHSYQHVKDFTVLAMQSSSADGCDTHNKLFHFSFSFPHTLLETCCWKARHALQHLTARTC